MYCICTYSSLLFICVVYISLLQRAVAFIEETEEESGGRVYIHCRAGHGRSAATVFAWLLYQNPDQDPEELNAWLVRKRNVRKTLWKQPSIKKFHSWAIRCQSLDGNDDFESKHNDAAGKWQMDENGEEKEWEGDTSIYDTEEEEETALSSEYEEVR